MKLLWLNSAIYDEKGHIVLSRVDMDKGRFKAAIYGVVYVAPTITALFITSGEAHFILVDK